MPRTINIPNIGPVNFPDGMSDDEIVEAIERDIIKQPPTPATSEPSPTPDFFAASNLLRKQEFDRAQEAKADDPSMVGSFLRNARENLGAGIGGALAGAYAGGKTGAAIGAFGGNPLTVGIGAIGGGLIGGGIGAFGGQKIQETVDPITAERQAALERDREVNPISSGAGALFPAVITGKFSPGTIRTALTPLARAANAAERAAIINSRINVGSEVAVGGAFDAGQSLAMDQPLDPRQIALNATVGALFSNPNRLGRALGQGAMIPAPEQPVEPVATTPEPTAPAAPLPPAASSTPAMRGPMVPLAPTPPAPAPPLVATGATRLADDLAQQAGIDPLTLTPSGAGATVTPNDVRAAGANLPAATMDSGGTIDVTPPRKPDPTLSDLIDTNVEWGGQVGKLVDDEGRPSLLRADGSLVELPFNYGTDRSLTELGIQPTFDRQQDRATATRFFGETENESLQSVFSVIDNNTDDLLDIAELGVSLKKQKGKKSIPVYDTPEFSPQLRSITDEQILVAEDQIKQAITVAQNNPTLSDETRTAVIDKLSGDLENIAAITAARDAGKYQRLPLPVGSAEVAPQRAGTTPAAPAPAAASRILSNPTPLPAEASAAPASAKLTLGPEETGIAPVALENAGTPPIENQSQDSPRVETKDPEFTELQDLTLRKGQAQNKVKEATFSKADEARLAELNTKFRDRLFESAEPQTDKVVGRDINGTPIQVSSKGTYYTFENGRVRTGPAFSEDTPAPETQAEAPVAKKELSARTRAKKLGAEIEATGKKIMAQRVKIDELKKGGAPKQTITKAENQLASLQSTQKELVAQRGEAKSEIPRVIKTVSKAASRILRKVDDNIDSFDGLRSLDGNRIRRPSPLVLKILGKKEKKIPLTAKENNILAANVKGGEYDDWIKISDIDAMPGTPEGREAAKEVLRSIYAEHDDYSASGPDTVVTGKDADVLWSELRSDLENIAQGKTGDHQDAYDAEMARQEAKFLEGEKLTLETQTEESIKADRIAEEERLAAKAKREAREDLIQETKNRANARLTGDMGDTTAPLFDDDSDDIPLFGFRPDERDSSDDPFSKTDAPARTADIAGVEKAADDFFGGKRPENVKVVNEPKADWEARVNGDTIELNAAKVGPEGVRSALHEEVGHTAFRDEKERAVFQRLYDSLDEATRTKINDTVDKLYSDAPTSVKAEEKLVKALRSILDRTPEGRTFWQKLLQIARRTWKNLTGQAAKDPEMIAAALLKRGMANVKSGMADGPTRYSKVDGTKPATSFREALDAAKQEVADRADYRTQAKTVLAEIAKLPKDQQKPARIRMYAELDEARIIGKGKDQQFKVEMPKVTQELIAGGRTPNEQDILNALVAKFPEQKGYLKKNFERLVTDMMFAEEMAMSGNKTPWGDYGDAMKEHLAEIASGVKDGSTLRHIQRGLSLFRNTYFNGIGGKMQSLAEGKITGKDSAAANKFFADIIGVRASQDGVNFEGADGLSEADLRRMNNERIKFDTDLDAYFKKEGINDAARAAWLERVADHVVNPARDAELAKEPKLKEAVDYFIKRRRERLAYLRNAGVDVGDAGERSLSRSIDTEKVLTNPKEFVEKAKRAYMRKWAREISQLRDQEAIKAAEGKDTTSIKDKIRELEKMDAQAAAEKYLYAITSDDNGISSDGNDITAAEGGGQPSFLKKREFGPEADELLGKFYHRNIAAMDTAEALATVRAATKARVLSSRSDGKIDPVGKWKALRAELEAEGNQDMIPIAAQLVKDYLNLNGSNNETVRRLVGHLHTYTQLAYLSHATVASLGEPAMIGARTGRITDTGRAYAQIAKGIVRALKKAGPDEIRILNRELGLVADSFDGLMSSNALGDSFGGRGKGGGLVTNFHRLTGLSGWTNLTFDAATKIGKSFISSQVKLAKAGGSMSTLAKRELNELGMSTKDIDVMAAFVTKLDKATDQNKLILGDDPGAALYRKALSMFHKTGGALNPTRGTRAQKANNPVAGMFYQLQSFLYDFHQKFTLRQARRLKDAYRGTVEIDGATEKLSARERSQVAIDAAKAVAAIYGLQFGIQVLRETLFVDLERNKRDKEKTKGEINMARALGAASRTGILGPYDTLFNIVSGARYQREPATVVLGPAVGGMSELFQSVVNLYGERNSANTNTAERKLARTGYNTIATPALNAVFAGMPAGPLSAALVQAFRHPLARESAVSAVAGPIQTKKKGPMKTTTYY